MTFIWETTCQDILRILGVLWCLGIYKGAATLGCMLVSAHTKGRDKICSILPPYEKQHFWNWGAWWCRGIWKGAIQFAWYYLHTKTNMSRHIKDSGCMVVTGNKKGRDNISLRWPSHGNRYDKKYWGSWVHAGVAVYPPPRLRDGVPRAGIQWYVYIHMFGEWWLKQWYTHMYIHLYIMMSKSGFNMVL